MWVCVAEYGSIAKDDCHMTRSHTGKLMLMAFCLALACAAVPVVVLAG